MELLYVGSVCNQNIFDATVANSKVKPSASAQSFEMALIRGFSQVDNVNLTCISTESIAAYPRGNRLFLERRTDALCDGVSTSIIPAINLPGLKNALHGMNAERSVRKWLVQTSGSERAVFLYGIYPAVAEACLRACSEAGCKCVCMITDIPQMMFTNTKSKGLLKRLFSGSYREKAVKLQTRFDGYIYLTEAMSQAVAPGKPYLVVETIVDEHIFDDIENEEKVQPPVLMYAGALYRKYGVDRIVGAFEKVGVPCQLWMFGSGDYEEELKVKAAQNPAIHYGGRISRTEVLKNERKATLLLNLRDCQDEYTKYSFPSKMVEYMLSGTPFLTTSLPGIPNEYREYTYMVDKNDLKEISERIEELLNNRDCMNEKGKQAALFISSKKNCVAQAKRIVQFITQL